jgi:hypothetical protein
MQRTGASSHDFLIDHRARLPLITTSCLFSHSVNHEPSTGGNIRTVIIIVVGFVLWAACLGVAKLLASSSTSSMTTATAAFVAIWFVAAAANLWIGVSQAGYSLQEELPIFLLIFLFPAAVAIIAKWKFL